MTLGPTTASPAGTVRQFLTGVGYLGKGFGMWITSPKLMFLGAIPALIVGLVYIAAMVFLAINIDAVAVWITPFAESWTEFGRTAVRVAASIALVIAAVLLFAYTYAAVTLAVGDPFYERIWRQVETRLGNPPPEPQVGIWKAIGRGIADGIRIVVPAVLLGLALFVCGFIPFVGPVLSAVLGALVGGWLLTVELTGFSFDSRGFTLRERREALRRHRATSVGFGAVTYLLFLVPIAAVVVMPAAVAGAAMLSRESLPARAPSPR